MTELAILAPGGALTRPDDDLARHVAGWLLGYRSERTRTAYRRDVVTFARWCAERDVDLFTARRAHVDAYARHLEARGAAPSTVARALSAISSFYRYLVEDDLVTRSPTTYVRRPKTSADSQTTGLDRDETRALLTAAKADSPRAFALLSLLTGNGLRISEALDADVADLGTERGHRVLRIVRKGGARATAPLAPPTATAIDDYLGDRTTGPLFATRTGGRLDQPYAFRLIRRLAKDAGIANADKLSPHSARHGFVTMSLDAGVPLHVVQDAAGHTDPRTTRGYDRARHNLDKHPAYALAAHLA